MQAIVLHLQTKVLLPVNELGMMSPHEGSFAVKRKPIAFLFADQKRQSDLIQQTHAMIFIVAACLV